MEALITKVQKYTLLALAAMLIVVMVLSTVHLGVSIGQKVWEPLEVALIAMSRKVIIEEPNTVPGLTLFGIAALILALGIAFYFERQAKRETGHGILETPATHAKAV
jgi:uncharacterized membrane protein (DUF373 family)